MKTIRLLIVAGAALTAVSCVTPKNFNYFQDLTDGQEISLPANREIKLQPGDKISVMVTSKDPLMSNVFNKGFSSSTDGEKVDANKIHVNYTVDNNGEIEIPSLGKVAVNGKSRLEAAQDIQNKLREELLKDATVTVEFVDLRFSVLGEVQAPGVYYINKDVYTLTDALAMAGGIGLYGKRDSVMVIREMPAGRKVYVVNISSGRDMLSSEAFYIKQNDIINVKANNTKARQSLANGNETRSISFWTTIVSLAATLSMLIFK